MKKHVDETAVQIALWWEQLKETNNNCFLPLFSCTKRFLVLKGGAGSGKSIFAGRKILERATSESGHRFLVCRKVARTLRESCFRQLCQQAKEHYPYAHCKINKSDMKISFANGSEIIFAGLDDVEKMKSIYSITGIWIEEASELLETDFNQLNLRLRGNTAHYKQIILSFNPTYITHWLKRRFFDTSLPNAMVHESTYQDNRFTTEEYKQELETLRHTSHYFWSVYCLGQWGITGNSVFNSQAITERLISLSPPFRVGQFTYDYDGKTITNRNWVDDASGYIQLYTLPVKGRPYVIGGDTAGDGSDYFAGQVLDNITGRQVATLRHKFDEDVYAKQMFCLGQYYNNALIGIEVNFSTYPVKELERIGYQKLYVREKEDSYTHKTLQSFGFKTTSLTRPVIIAELIQVVREDISLVVDKETLEEMITFVRNEKLRPEAEAGAHDDCIMALAIAHHIRPQQRFTLETAVGSRGAWTADMWEDYNNASEGGKQYLLSKWAQKE